jgi:signal transduction histidine kinase
MVRRTTALGGLHIDSVDELSLFAPECREQNVIVSLEALLPPVESLLRPQVRNGLAGQVGWLLTQPKPVVSLLGPAWLDESVFATEMWRGAMPWVPYLAGDFEDFVTLMVGSVGVVLSVLHTTPDLRDVRSVGLIYATSTFGQTILEGTRRHVASSSSNLTVAAEFAVSPPVSLAETLQLVKSTGLRVIVLGLGSEYMPLFAESIKNESMTSDDGYTYLVPHAVVPAPGMEEFVFVGQGSANPVLLDHVRDVLKTSSPDYQLDDLLVEIPAVGSAFVPTAWRCIPYDETRALVHCLNATVEAGLDPRTPEGAQYASATLRDIEKLSLPGCMASVLSSPVGFDYMVAEVTRDLDVAYLGNNTAVPYKEQRLAFTPDTCAGGTLFVRPVGAAGLVCAPCPAGLYNDPTDGLEECRPCMDNTVLVGGVCQFCPPPAVAETGDDGIPVCVTRLDISMVIIVVLIVMVVCCALLGSLHARAQGKEKELALALAKTESDNTARLTSMLALVSHELRTPLQLIMLNVDLLAASDPAQERVVESINKSCVWLSSVVAQILDACKLNAGVLKLSPSVFCLRSLVHECVELVVPKIAGKRVVLYVEVEIVGPKREHVFVNVDAPRLRQVLLNLLFNAAKYTSLGYIELYLRYDPKGESIFRVTDTGPGVPRAERAALFEQFSQVQSVSSNVLRGGTGLGLYIAKSMLDLMHGKIQHRDNKDASNGSVFEATLPLPAASTKSAPLALVLDKESGRSYVIAVGIHFTNLRNAYVRALNNVVPGADCMTFNTLEEFQSVVAASTRTKSQLLVLADDEWVADDDFCAYSVKHSLSLIHLAVWSRGACDHQASRSSCFGCLDRHVDALALKRLVHAWTSESSSRSPSPTASAKSNSSRNASKKVRAKKRVPK